MGSCTLLKYARGTKKAEAETDQADMSLRLCAPRASVHMLEDRGVAEKTGTRHTYVTPP